ncbi:MAG: NADP-dependent malic enzyme, partial [Bacteroidales bacterium]|nr:NADP-dependent malic enzyme [Bacteroidales bacterium]
GRSDYPNQVNNVLGFPFIFRGALDVRATKINEEMKIAAVHALAALAREDVPDTVNIAYNTQNIRFGREYLIPKPLDPRLITTVAPAIAKAAIETGVARKKITDWSAYKLQLQKRMGLDNQLVEVITNRAKRDPKRILFGQASNLKMLKAVQAVIHDGIAKPILLGNPAIIQEMIRKYGLDIEEVPVIDIHSDREKKRIEKFAKEFEVRRARKGITYGEAFEMMHLDAYFGSMMVEMGEADAFISGFSSKYPDIIRPALQVVGTRPDTQHIAGMYILMTKKGPFFFADTTVNRNPNTQTLVDTALLAAEGVRRFNIEPKIALLSYSNFGSVRDGSPAVVAEAVRILHEQNPDLIVDGEMQANFALNKEMRKRRFPFTKLAEHDVNTLIFPNLDSGNIAYKMMQELAGSEVIGPIILGMNKPIHVLALDSSVREIIHLAAIATVDAQ